MRRRAETVVDLKFLLTVYDCFLRDMGVEKIAKALEVPLDTLYGWTRTHPDVKMAREFAEERRKQSNDFKKYILGKLSPEAMKVWNKVKFWVDADEISIPREMMRDISTDIRKEIFLQALASSKPRRKYG